MSNSLLSQINLGTSLKLKEGATVAEHFSSPADLLNAIIPNILLLSSIILLFILFFGGFTFISSGGNAEQAEKGKQAITGAIIGFVVIFASFWIIQIIQIITGINIINSNII